MEVIEKVRPYIVHVSTPAGQGTGFFLHKSGIPNQLCAIATAGHVVKEANDWNQPVRVFQPDSGVSHLIEGVRFILIDEPSDTALVCFAPPPGLKIPDPPDLARRGQVLKLGCQIGWLGFPHFVWPPAACFFKGTISSWCESGSFYYVDGVAINGVSGGPAIAKAGNDWFVIGVVTAYVSNMLPGYATPGLSRVSNVFRLQETAAQLRTIDDAMLRQAQELPKPEPPRDPLAPPWPSAPRPQWLRPAQPG
jgi:hypothetical protein